MKTLIKKLLRESLLKEDVLTKDEFFIKYGIGEDDLSYLGSGDFGKAYSIGDNKVLKITNSKSEFGFAKEIAGKNIPALDGFADIYVAEKVGDQYYIIMEELDEDSDIEDLYYQVEELLSNEGLPIQYLHMLDTDELELDDDLLKFISDIEDINSSYRYLGIEASDIKPDNLGVDKNGKVKAFDIDDRLVNEQYKGIIDENVSGVDQILDKINQSGINSLSDFEKKTLNDANSNDDMDIIVKNWLDSNYSDLQTINQTRNSFGKTKPFILFLDNDGELVMEYDVKSKTLYLPYQDITKYLGDHFDSKTFQDWFDNVYNIRPKKISNFFTNQKSL